jgi:hypothetical protein
VVDSTFLACPVCTTKLRQACRHCQQPLEPAWQICPYCETPVDQQPTMAMPPLEGPEPDDWTRPIA